MGCCAGVNRNINLLNDISIIENKGEFLKIKEPNTDIQGTQKTGKEEIKKKKLSNKSQNVPKNDNKDIQKTDNKQDVQKNEKEGQKRVGNVKGRPSSKTQNEQVKKGNIANCSKFLFYNNSENKDFISKDNKSLESVMKNRDITTYGISKELLKICKKIEKLRGPIEDYKEKDIINNGVEYDGYQQLFDEEAIVEDLETQKNQMIKLFENCEKDITICLFDFFKWYDNNLNNTQAAVEEENKKNFAEIMVQLKFNYDSYLPSQKIINEINTNEEEDKINNDRFLKNLDIQTWKIEVDLENIKDILIRFKSSQNPTIIKKKIIL